MKCQFFFKPIAVFFLLSILSFSEVTFAQNQTKKPNPKSDFWKHTQIGGSFGLNAGTGYTDILVAPTAIYNFNSYFSAGLGLQGSLVSVKNRYSSAIYGASIIALFNPVEEIQLSVELEELRVNRTIESLGSPSKIDNFWNTGLYVGGGFRSNNVTVGARYNLLYNENDLVYSAAFMPFVRVYF